MAKNRSRFVDSRFRGNDEEVAHQVFAVIPAKTDAG